MGDNDQPWELWVALVIGMIVVTMQHREKKWPTRALIAGVSGGIGYLVGPEITLTWLGPMSTVILATSFSYAVLDIGFGLLRDRELVTRVARKLAGFREGGQ